MIPARRSHRRTIANYGVTALLSLIIATLTFHLWQADLHVPFNYSVGGQDAFWNMMVVKTLGETGWISHNPNLGAPGSLNQLDFPVPDALHFVLMRVIGFCVDDFGRTINIYYLLTFPLLAMATLFAARFAGLSEPASLGTAQLAAFMPFHILRGETHLTLSSFYLLPLTIPPMLRLARGERLGTLAWPAGITFALVGLSNVYHMAFSVFFLLIALAIGFARSRNWDRRLAAQAAMLALLSMCTFGIQLVPNLAHRHAVGVNPMAANRSPADADTFGLRIAQMILPVPGHRLVHLAQLREVYAEEFPLVNENESAALGLVGALGFLFLLARLGLGLVRKTNLQQRSNVSITFDTLAMLTFAGLLLGTIGGFGSIFDLLVSPFVRALNRVSIDLGLFALLAAGLAADRFIKSARPRVLLWSFILVFGLLDQIPATATPSYQANESDFRSDARFVAMIESSVPRGAMIFQLPIVDYPESPPVHLLSDYELFRGYLHSQSVNWSYGAMKGRETWQWEHSLAGLPVAAEIEMVRHRGFAGVYLDRNGYADAAVESQLKAMLGPPQVSDNRRLLFFSFPHAPSPTTGVSASIH